MRRFTYRLERIFSRIAVSNLMPIIIGAMVIVSVAGTMYPELYALLSFDRGMILRGQVWRVVTFLFVHGGSLIETALFAYFYWWIGSSLEDAWGTGRFCTYYYAGVILTVIAGFITGASTNMFLNLSLFFAFAMLYPEQEILLFFVIPVKVKWLAWIDAAMFVFYFIFNGWAGRAAILAAVLTLVLFFWDDIVRRVRFFIQDMKFRGNRYN